MSNGNIAQEFESFRRSRTAPTSLGGEFERFRQEQQRLAESAPAEELQRSFRAAREPVEQPPGLAIPGTRVEAAPAPTPRRPLVGRVAAQAALRPPPEAKLLEAARTPVLPLTKLLPEGPPTATLKAPIYKGPFIGGRAPRGQLARTVELPVGGAARGAVEVAESLTSPLNIALLVNLGLTAKALPMLGRIIAAGFSGEMIAGAISEYPELRERLNAGDEQGVAQVATRMGLTGLLGALAGAHAVRGRAAAGEVSRVRPAVERARAAKPAPPERACRPHSRFHRVKPPN